MSFKPLVLPPKAERKRTSLGYCRRATVINTLAEQYAFFKSNNDGESCKLIDYMAIRLCHRMQIDYSVYEKTRRRKVKNDKC